MTISRILVVEDDARLAATLERVLVAEGHGVEVVGDGLQALRRAQVAVRFDMELRILRAGETRWLHLTGLATRNDSGEVVRWTGTTKDVTARKSAAEALRISEERYALAIQASGEGHWDWKISSDEFYASPRYLEIGGFPPGAVPAGSSTRTLPPGVTARCPSVTTRSPGVTPALTTTRSPCS